MKWIFIGLGILFLIGLVRKAAPPSWPTDDEAKKKLLEEQGEM
jgi:hypothetical protein